MTAKKHMSSANSKWLRLRELLVTTLVGGLPTLALGVVLRRLLYRIFVSRIGASTFIQDGVEFIGASCIEIGDGVHIFRGVRIDGRGQNNRICLGNQVAIERGVDIGACENSCIEIGERTFIGPYTCIAGPGDIKIGKDCLIAAHSGIFANAHKFANPLEKIRNQEVIRKGIVIEDDCWLGHGVTVLDGVTIGQGSVIGAGAVVTRDIPSYSVAVGVPARVIDSRKPTKSVNGLNKEYMPKNSSQILVLPSAALAEVEEATKIIHRLQDTSNTSLRDSRLEDLLYRLLDCIKQAFAVDTIALLLLSEKGGQHLYVRATLGLEEEIEQEVQIPWGRGFAGAIAASREPMIVNDLSMVEVVSPILRTKGLRSMLGVPLLAEGQEIGVFHIGTVRPRQFTRDDAQLLQVAAESVSCAVLAYNEQ
jgi:acetyltransferase-like isoleucine patch superfamily enzyme